MKFQRGEKKKVVFLQILPYMEDFGESLRIPALKSRARLKWVEQKISQMRDLSECAI